MPIGVESRHQPGVILLSCGDLARYMECMNAFWNMLAPVGGAFCPAIGYDVCRKRNEAIRHMMEHPGLEWVWIVDDDHVFHTEMLMRLLERDVEIVSPLVSTRAPRLENGINGFVPIVAELVDGWEGKNDGQWFLPPEVAGQRWRYLTWEEIPQQGMIRTCIIGGGGVLIRRAAFEKIGKEPWYEAGQFGNGELMEDIFISRKFEEAGVEMWVDCEQHMGHLTPASIWPHPGVGVDIGFDSGRTRYTVPHAQPKIAPTGTTLDTMLAGGLR